ncbi:MAG: hypothetical protein JSR33_07745 [Proteobacteria bacterium]|nr:hypothetical protein [Pseudomonadota bacterium]
MKTKGSLYGLSLITGLIGTVLTVELEVSDSKENSSSVAHRALYAFILFIAGILFESARIAARSKTQYPPSEKAVTPPQSPSIHEEKSPISIREEKFDETLSGPASSTAVVLIELKSSPIEKEEKFASADSDDKTIPAVEISDVAAISPAPRAGWRHRLSSCLNVAHNLIPTAWFAQSLTLFLQTVLEESITSNLLPYTVLSGLATGYLFRISIKPWRLGGIRRWIENHRNEFVVVEFLVGFIMLSFKSINSYFCFSATTASFWTGYNLEEFTTLIATKLFQRFPSDRKIQSNELMIKQLILPRLSTAILISLGGATCSGLSLLVIPTLTTDTNQSVLRNYAALWMASIGNYVFAYPLGIYIGRYLPRRYYDKAVTAATYLLVPFASPELTIPHYLLLIGAGLCGGLSHFILKAQYYHQLDKMQQCKRLTDALLLNAQSFLYLLPQLSLPNDLLLQQHQQKKRKMTLIIKTANILSVFIILYGAVDFFIKNRLAFGINLLIGGLLTVGPAHIGGFYLLPRYLPSTYRLIPLSLFKQFFYQNSVSLVFLFKIALTLLSKARLFNITNNDAYPNSQLFNVTLYSLVLGFTGMKMWCRREWGYQSYVPSVKDIKQFAAALKPEALEQRLKSGELRLSCNYHLLKFMQENPPTLSRARSLSGNQPENKTLLNELLRDQDNKLSSSQSERIAEVNLSPAKDNSALWLPQLLWQPLQRVNQPQVVEGKLSVPVAVLCEENSAEAKLTLEADFNNAHDQSYTHKRLDISFELRAFDAAIRGPVVVGQFAFGLPKGLSLSPDITSFRF